LLGERRNAEQRAVHRQCPHGLSPGLEATGRRCSRLADVHRLGRLARSASSHSLPSMTDTPPASEIRTTPTRVRRYGPTSEQSSAAGMIPLVPTVHPALVLEEEGRRATKRYGQLCNASA